MKRFLTSLLFLSLLSGAAAHAAVETGSAAPDFTLSDLNEKSVSLSDFKGKFVVLEWFNPGCPFVQKFYKPGKMQEWQQGMGDDVVWLTINSTNPANSDFRDHTKTQELVKEWNLKSHAMLIDRTGEVGKLYNAKTTPHMYVINPEGILIYQGAIDDTRSTDSDDIATAKNYVEAALEAGRNGEEVDPGSTRPYGCNVKY